jgi:hypothetical protein
MDCEIVREEGRLRCCEIAFAQTCRALCEAKIPYSQYVLLSVDIKLRGLSPRANYTDRVTATFRRS